MRDDGKNVLSIPLCEEVSAATRTTPAFCLEPFLSLLTQNKTAISGLYRGRIYDCGSMNVIPYPGDVVKSSNSPTYSSGETT